MEILEFRAIHMNRGFKKILTMYAAIVGKCKCGGKKIKILIMKRKMKL